MRRVNPSVGMCERCAAVILTVALSHCSPITLIEETSVSDIVCRMVTIVLICYTGYLTSNEKKKKKRRRKMEKTEQMYS